MSNALYNKIISVCIALVTVIATLVAFLQSDASSRDDVANRDSSRLALEALGLRLEGQARVNFAYDKAYQTWFELDALVRTAESREDELAAQRYASARDAMLPLTPLMQPPYFNPDTGEANLAAYESDVYLRQVTRLEQQFNAAASVKDAWDTKANTYVVHLTMLAVALFLLGLSATLEGGKPRAIFAVVGLSLAAFASTWAFTVYQQPVFDLREFHDAIDQYAEGFVMLHQGRHAEAEAAFDQAIRQYPDYTSAYVWRASARGFQDNLEGAVADYEQAARLGAKQASVTGNHAYTLYMLGRFDEAATINRQAIDAGRADLWMQFDLGLALLSSGQSDEARAAYQAGMASASARVAEALANGQAAPSELWWSLDDGAGGLVNWIEIVQDGTGQPDPALMSNPQASLALAQDLLRQLKSLNVSLETRGAPPSGPLTARISNLSFGMPLYDEDGEFFDHEVGDVFEYGINEISALFDYEGMADGQEVLVKVYVDGVEDPSWRVFQTWDGGSEGSYVLPIATAYSETFVFSKAEFTVELYVDGQLAASGAFLVE